jgi:polar amino acid transport system substrate-binding protein
MRASRLIALMLFLAASCAAPGGASLEDTRRAAAPTGKLRVGMILAANHAVRDPATSELRGIAIDLGREAARRLGVPFEPVAYASFDALWAGAKKGEWDMATMGTTPERAAAVDFTQPYMSVEYAFLVVASSQAMRPPELDRANMRIGVLKQSAPDQYLTTAMRNVQIVRSTTVNEMVESAQGGNVDALFGTRIGMGNQKPKLAGSRLLDEAFGGEATAIAVPKGRPLAATYAARFVMEAKADGSVKRIVEKAALPGVVPAQ